MLHMTQNSYNIRIVEALLKSENHIRGLAKVLNTNQMTISRRLEQLHRENIVDYRKEGKNKVYFIKKTLEAKQYCCIVEMFRLLKIIKKYPVMRRIVEQIRKNDSIRLALLFGSYAKGNPQKESDIDIYIETRDKKIKEQVELINSRISVKMGNYDNESLLVKEIEKNHIVIQGVERYYEKNKFFD